MPALKAETASAKAVAEQAVEAEKAASNRSVELAARLQEARARVLTDGGGGSGGSGAGLSENGITSQLTEIRKLGLELQVERRIFFFCVYLIVLFLSFLQRTHAPVSYVIRPHPTVSCEGAQSFPYS